MTQDGIFRRRQLPHWDVEGKPIFITACLEGSISAAGLARIRNYRTELDKRQRPDDVNENDWEHTKQKLVFKLTDELLDHQSRRVFGISRTSGKRKSSKMLSCTLPTNDTNCWRSS